MMGSHSWKGRAWPYGPVAFRLFDVVETFLQMKSEAVKTDPEGWGGGGSPSEPRSSAGLCGSWNRMVVSLSSRATQMETKDRGWPGSLPRGQRQGPEPRISDSKCGPQTGASGGLYTRARVCPKMLWGSHVQMQWTIPDIQSRGNASLPKAGET